MYIVHIFKWHIFGYSQALGSDSQCRVFAIYLQQIYILQAYLPYEKSDIPPSEYPAKEQVRYPSWALKQSMQATFAHTQINSLPFPKLKKSSSFYMHPYGKHAVSSSECKKVTMWPLCGQLINIANNLEYNFGNNSKLSQAILCML